MYAYIYIYDTTHRTYWLRLGTFWLFEVVMSGGWRLRRSAHYSSYGIREIHAAQFRKL